MHTPDMSQSDPPKGAPSPAPLTLSVSLPDRRLCGNGRVSPFTRSRLVQAQREEAFYVAREALLQVARPEQPHTTAQAQHPAYFPSGRVRVSVVVHRPTHWDTRALDDDNFWRGLKATLDGLQDARIVTNDRQF